MADRKGGPEPTDEEEEEDALEEKLERKILEILHKRAASSTMCPSEAARAISPTNWRLLMDKTREVARRMAISGEIHITQKGAVCNPSAEFKGPIRLKIAGGWHEGIGEKAYVLQR